MYHVNTFKGTPDHASFKVLYELPGYTDGYTNEQIASVESDCAGLSWMQFKIKKAKFSNSYQCHIYFCSGAGAALSKLCGFLTEQYGEVHYILYNSLESRLKNDFIPIFRHDQLGTA